MWFIYTMEYYSAIKIMKPAIVTTWMDLEDVKEVSHKEKDK